MRVTGRLRSRGFACESRRLPTCRNRRAFSGAARDRKGLVEEADHGTLFLDEIAETSPGFQAKLLRVLQERAVRPLGANRERPVDVRIVAATHRDLRRAVAEARFREDLYYRVAVLDIAIPPLRERVAEIRPLAEHLLAKHAAAERKPDCRIGDEAHAWLETRLWPGNVRELENEIQHALALADPGDLLTRQHFSSRPPAPLQALAAPLETLPDEPLRDSVARLEALLIRRALAAHGGHRARTAKRLGIRRPDLWAIPTPIEVRKLPS